MGCTGDANGEAESSTSNITAHALPLAPELPDHCQDAEIVRIDRPVDKDAPSRGTYSYAFRYKAPATPGAPVVVYLPGGPGSSSTQTTLEHIPDGWGYLLTDPRGVGCNTLASVPPEAISSEFFKTEEIAEDVIAAIRDRQLDNYIVYGLSYGTLLGTTVAHEIEAQSVTPPKAVVLEGVLGRAFGADFVGQEYITQWDRVRTVLPADVLEELDTKESPYGISPRTWSVALMALLPMSPRDAASFVASLSTTLGSTEEEREAARQTIVDIGASQDDHAQPGAIELYRQVACREIMDTVPASDLDVVFQHGKLVRNVAEEGSKCRGLHVTAPYDAARLQFSAKLYDFIGQHDVATPAWQGNYHFDTHEGHAVRVTTLGGGHNPLQYNQASCAQDLMKSIATGGEDFAAVVATCPVPTEVDTH